MAKEFSHNRRESNPVVCKVVEGNNLIKDGTILIVHHNRFVEHSPHYIGDNLYSLAYNDEIFAKVGKDGSAKPICNNILVEYVFEDKDKFLPAHLRKPNKHKYKVIHNGYGFKKGQEVFAFPFSNYEIVYIYEGVEHRVIKLKKNDIVAKVL